MSETTTETREQAAARDLEQAQRGVEEVLEAHQPGERSDISVAGVR